MDRNPPPFSDRPALPDWSTEPPAGHRWEGLSRDRRWRAWSKENEQRIDEERAWYEEQRQVFDERYYEQRDSRRQHHEPSSRREQQQRERELQQQERYERYEREQREYERQQQRERERQERYETSARHHHYDEAAPSQQRSSHRRQGERPHDPTPSPITYPTSTLPPPDSSLRYDPGGRHSARASGRGYDEYRDDNPGSAGGAALPVTSLIEPQSADATYSRHSSHRSSQPPAARQRRPRVPEHYWHEEGVSPPVDQESASVDSEDRYWASTMPAAGYRDQYRRDPTTESPPPPPAAHSRTNGHRSSGLSYPEAPPTDRYYDDHHHRRRYRESASSTSAVPVPVNDGSRWAPARVPRSEHEARQLYELARNEARVEDQIRMSRYEAQKRFRLAELIEPERAEAELDMRAWRREWGSKWDARERMEMAAAARSRSAASPPPPPMYGSSNGHQRRGGATAAAAAYDSPVPDEIGPVDVEAALENKRKAKAAVKVSRAKARKAKNEMAAVAGGASNNAAAAANNNNNHNNSNNVDSEIIDLIEDDPPQPPASDAIDDEFDELLDDDAEEDMQEDASAPIKRSRRRGKKEEAGEEDGLEYDPPRFNKDGSKRKKPGPPKGTKKPPPRATTRARQAAAAAAAAAAAHGGYDVDQSIASELGDGAMSVGSPSVEPSVAHSAAHADSRRNISYSDEEDEEGESGVDEEEADDWDDVMPSPPRDEVKVEDEVDDELDDLLESSERPKKRRRKEATRSAAQGGFTPSRETSPMPVDGYAENYPEPKYSDAYMDHFQPRQGGAATTFEEARADVAPEDSISDYESPPPGEPINNAVAIARNARVEYMQHLIWKDIVNHQIPRVRRHVNVVITNKMDNARRVAVTLSRAQRKYATRTFRTAKDLQLRARKATKEAILFWKRNEKEEIEARKRAEREELEKARAEEANRERARAANRLNYLLGAGELYSKLMKKKIKTDEAMDSPDTMADPTKNMENDDGMDVDEQDDDEDEDAEAGDDAEASEAVIRKRAAARAKAIMQKNAQDAAEFDRKVADEREEIMGDNAEAGGLTTESLDFQNPLEGETSKRVTQPKMLQATLKEYQIKGLSWLANLYESGINGILADEMGLGKVSHFRTALDIRGALLTLSSQTIQSISLLAWLAENQNIWGPFLVVAPASTVHNWQQELARFVPRLKAIPYWGQPADRKVLRRDWSRKSITFTEDAPFHIVVTSYDMAVLDHSYFSKVRWQYMVLDEAQAVKNASSQRWTSLLSLKTRNRLLLTGTPIQNSMNELWALLHFIMPDLFNSLEDFTEWFSKGIEGVAGGRDNQLSSQQLRRLHDVLRPFMLRRVKKNVQSELGDKIEKDLVVEISPRQKAIYRALRGNSSIRALLAQAADGSDSALKVKSLMNIVMQFRKVCNHPDLFERADVTTPYCFGKVASSGELMRETTLYCPESTSNPIEYVVPKLVWEDSVRRPAEGSRAGFDTHYLQNLLSVWSPDNIVRSYRQNGEMHPAVLCSSLSRVSHQVKEHPLVTALVSRVKDNLKQVDEEHARKPLSDISLNAWKSSYLSRNDARFVIEVAVAPPINIVSSSRTFLDDVKRSRQDPIAELAMYGLPPPINEDPAMVTSIQETLPDLPPSGLMSMSTPDQTPSANMRFPNMKRLIFDSAKLARLDSLLRELKAGGHRCLIYFQMTRMMSIMEEYLVYRQYKYLRLDGSTAIGDRRDMVNAWQTNPDLFVFLLSTKAGGLGINLTAADTVIFYDHDWNPSNDSQAMDRAHRLGQTRQVTVYRLICRGTVDERILHLARNKKDVQDIVVGNKSLAEINSQKEIVSLLLDDGEDDMGADSGFGRSAAFKTGFGNPSFDDGDEEDNFFPGANGKKSKSGTDTPATAEGGGAAPKKAAAKRKSAGGAADGDKPKRQRNKKAADGPADGEPKAKRARKSTAASKASSAAAAAAKQEEGGSELVTASVSLAASGAGTPVSEM